MILSRRKFLAKSIQGMGVLSTIPAFGIIPSNKHSMGPATPVSVYVNWAAYDELSDQVFLDEDIAMRQFNELLRLKEAGVQFDYYLMDAFWFDKDGAYRQWRKESWPEGGKKWMETCFAHDIKPGLWISTNLMYAGGENYHFLSPAPAWQDSVDKNDRSFSLFEGGYLTDLIEALTYHADQGISMFKFDFADFNAVTAKSAGKMTQEEVVEANKSAFIDAIKGFRKSYPDVLLMAYNGFGGVMGNTYTPYQKAIDLEWLNIFDSMYCGDPRPADVPCMNFWRSKDIYSDHMVKQFAFNDIPLKRIDNSAFMIGTTGTCYFRGAQAWKGMLLLSMARGGWINTYYGNLDLLSDKDGKWFAQAQSMFYPLQQQNHFTLIGGIPGQDEWYGYQASGKKGELILLVNPSQKIRDIDLSFKKYKSTGAVLFHDAGFVPEVSQDWLKIGPEQLVLIGYGEYDQPSYNLGIGDFIRIPSSIKPISTDWKISNQIIQTELNVSQEQDIRIIIQQFGSDGLPVRSSGGSPPHGITLGHIIQIEAYQEGKAVPLQVQYDKAIWSGLSWGVAEIRAENLDLSKKLLLMGTSAEKNPVVLKGELYAVSYRKED
ncbi:MAG: hypothetical protein ACNS62_15905 [Candidatus Cyclobacteriaceae bacterium M3_2C_046]